MRYCGREFTEKEMDLIHSLIATGVNRQKLSRMFCEEVNWRKPDGGVKEMSCKVAFLKMHRDGHIILPAPTKPANNHLKKPKATLFTLPPEVAPEVGALDLSLVDIRTSALWNDYIERYHYLGYAPLPGAQLRYFVKSHGQTLALLGFSAAAWKVAPRDEFIGWDAATRKKNRPEADVPRRSVSRCSVEPPSRTGPASERAPSASSSARTNTTVEWPSGSSFKFVMI